MGERGGLKKEWNKLRKKSAQGEEKQTMVRKHAIYNGMTHCHSSGQKKKSRETTGWVSCWTKSRWGQMWGLLGNSQGLLPRKGKTGSALSALWEHCCRGGVAFKFGANWKRGEGELPKRGR